MTIKAIETQYKGYRFRSRLEARWAYFFDVCELQWFYEPEGFAVNGTPYLPDFKLTQQIGEVAYSSWVEIKHKGWTDYEGYSSLLKEIAIAKSEPTLLICGDPFDCFVTPVREQSDYPVVAFTPAGEQIDSPRIEILMILGIIKYDDAVKIAEGSKESAEVMWPSLLGILTAMKSGEKARKARFEHGETPR